MSRDGQGVAFAQLKEKLWTKELPALREAGLLSPDTIRFLESYRKNYEPGSGTHHKTGEPAAFYHNTVKYVEWVRPEVGARLSRAVDNGNWGVIEHAIGLVEDDGRDVPFAEALQLEDLIHGDEFKILVFTGGQGGGKSYLAYTLAKYKYNLCERDGIPIRAITNSLSAVELNEELEFVGSPRELLDYRMENPGHIVFVLDEASSFFGAKAGQGADLAKFIPVLRRLRKMGILPIIVSHRAMDIGPDIRNLESTVFVHKPDKDTAVFYEDDTGDELREEMFSISGYTTDERYDFKSDDLFISWSWDGLEEIHELVENPQEFKRVWERKGRVKDLREVAEDIERVAELEERRDDLIEEVAGLDYTRTEIAEFANLSPQRVGQVLD